MFDPLIINSHRGAYSVYFRKCISDDLCLAEDSQRHYIVDANVARLHSPLLKHVLSRPSTLLIEASEESKGLEAVLPIYRKLISSKVRRGHVLFAIGGGVIQDITCFIASTLLRGLAWHFAPTTLLAQADSCIGSKSSINFSNIKNIIGTFNPPRSVYIWPGFLQTLRPVDIKSGLGEMIKAHIIDGADSFDRISRNISHIYNDDNYLLRYINASLHIKREYVEKDEFDLGIRNLFNYGHSFGHAIESATSYSIPHGIAVTIGMDMANFIAVEQGLLSSEHFYRMHQTLRSNYEDCASLQLKTDRLFDALTRDKKNTSDKLKLILPIGENAKVQIVDVPFDESFKGQCSNFLSTLNT